jgi:hypothetical protein
MDGREKAFSGRVDVSQIKTRRKLSLVNRPHPGPLPQEKGNLPPVSWKVVRQNWPNHLPNKLKAPMAVPSPRGEGQGEGGRDTNEILVQGERGTRLVLPPSTEIPGSFQLRGGAMHEKMTSDLMDSVLP